MLDAHPIWANHMRWLCFLPIYHAYALILLLHQSIRRGGLLVIMNKFDFGAMARAIEKHRIEVLPLVPPVLLAIAKSPETRKYDWSSLKAVITGAAPTSEELRKAGAEAVGTAVFEGHGMTETSGCAILSSEKTVAGRVGWPLPGLQVRIVDNQGKDVVKSGERGELWLRGPNIMLYASSQTYTGRLADFQLPRGYLNNEQANKETFEEGGWMRTGDIAVQHENGELSIVDRMKELIKVKALQVAPAEYFHVLRTDAFSCTELW